MEPEGFRELHQKLCSEAISGDSNRALNAKRELLLLTCAHAASRHPDWLTSEIYEKHLREYSQLVDDRKTINNFAAPTLELAAKLRKDCKGWTSSLPLDHSNVGELLKNKRADCAHSNENGCARTVPSETDLAQFKKVVSQSLSTASRSRSFNVGCEVPQFAKTSNLAPHFPSNDFNRQISKDSKSTGFAVKKTHSFPITGDSFKNDLNSSTNQHYGGGSFKRSNPSSSANPTETRFGPQTGGGVYFNRVGGRFKKWGGQDKEEPGHSDGPKRWTDEYGANERGSRTFGQRNSSEDSMVRGNEDVCPSAALSSFKTAGQQLRIETSKKRNNNFSGPSEGGHSGGSHEASSYHPAKYIKKSLGGKGVVNSKFVSPLLNNHNQERKEADGGSSQSGNSQGSEEVDERLKNIEPRMIELIKNEIMDCGSKITWDDIAGLHFAKTTIQEIVVWPMLRPDIFTGLRRPPKGILLFGPPGTGKTLIGKCIASQSGSTFFSISASSLTSKWIGEGEKMVRALFAVARVHQPAVIFIDEIDSLLSQRSETEHESSRRIKTEFLVQLDGAGTDDEDRLLVIGATNRPQELDEAARRRLVKRLYIPLPDQEARKELVMQLMKSERNDLAPSDIDEVAKSADGFSGADMKHLCQEACLGPIRSLGPSQISSIAAHQVRSVNMSDFTTALTRVHASVGPEDLHQYVTWNKTYGSGA